MSLGTILLIILVIALLGGFSGLGGGPFTERVRQQVYIQPDCRATIGALWRKGERSQRISVLFR
jgi:hypothetical protein